MAYQQREQLPAMESQLIEVRWLTSGELAASVEAEQVSNGSNSPRLKELKAHLQWRLRVPRVRQTLLRNGSILADADVLSRAAGPWHLDLIVSTGQEASEAQQKLLDTAARRNNADGMEDLLQSCHPDSCNAQLRRSPLFLASQNNSGEVAALLLEAMADVNFADIDGLTPLWTACQRGHLHMVQRLIAARADVHKTTEPVVKHRAGDGAFGSVKAPLSPPLSVVRGPQAAHIISLLIETEADINLQNGRGESPLWIAASDGAEPRLRSLLSFRADVNAVDRSGATPFFKACDVGGLPLLQHLLDARADIDKPDNRCVSPLLAASRRGWIKICELLIAKSADPQQANKKGATPVWAASRAGWVNVVQSLIAGRADANMPNRFGVTPLIISTSQAQTWKDRVKVVQKLLELSADKDKSDDHGVSPLWMACSRGNLSSVKVLLDVNANLEQATRKGTSAMQTACKGGHLEIVQLLEEADEDCQKGQIVSRPCIQMIRLTWYDLVASPVNGSSFAPCSFRLLRSHGLHAQARQTL